MNLALRYGQEGQEMVLPLPLNRFQQIKQALPVRLKGL
jgi:hypothetical protein